MDLYCNKKPIIQDIIQADTFIKRLRGYMFHVKPHVNCIVLSPCDSIHTFFMKFDIDVLFLDVSGKVVKKIEGLTPNKVIYPLKDVNTTVETASGGFSQVVVGDMIELK